ncbi:hypothetical protein [uncultured Jatrophihabitans sp.]|uniref:hypothetical protein n=1 Tax=uncultured Jatrophihabitans sp. TaxID=1610747 RepID=UPI0035CAAD93
MTTMRKKTATALGLAGALVGASAVVAAGSGAVSAAPAARKVITYRVDHDGDIHGPTHLRPGKAVIKLKGFASQAFQLIKPHSKKDTTAVALHDLGEVNAGHTADLLRHFSLVGGASPHDRFYVSLEKGTYYAVDSNNASPTVGQILTITVSGKKQDATFPTASRIVASGEHNWSKNPKTIPAKGVLRFSNEAHDAHFVSLAKLKKGKTLADVKKAFAGSEDPNKVFVSKGKHIALNLGVVSPGRGERGSYTLSRGTYLLACFWPDRKTGMPHALMGMIRLLKVT